MTTNLYAEKLEQNAISNKYTRWYLRLCLRAGNRSDLQGYIEEHHVLPRCLGGNSEKTNLVILTAREHFIAHLLLTKMFRGQRLYKMLAAAFFMANRTRMYRGSRTYQTLRENYAQEVSNHFKGVPICSDVLAARIGKSHDHHVLPHPVHQCILVGETIAEFGHDPRILKSMSNRKVKVRYPCCGTILDRPFYAANRGLNYCKSCFIQKNLEAMNTFQGRKEAAERMRDKWTKASFREHTSRAVSNANKTRRTPPST
jgi:hypothetical protein